MLRAILPWDETSFSLPKNDSLNELVCFGRFHSRWQFSIDCSLETLTSRSLQFTIQEPKRRKRNECHDKCDFVTLMLQVNKQAQKPIIICWLCDTLISRCQRWERSLHSIRWNLCAYSGYFCTCRFVHFVLGMWKSKRITSDSPQCICEVNWMWE